MLTKLMSGLIMSSALLAACNSQRQNTHCHNPKAGMEQFVEDGQFQAAHPVPGPGDTIFTGTMVRYPVAGGDSAAAYLVQADVPSKRYLLLFHEWWGLNNHIKQEAELWCRALQTNVLALDLYDGKVAFKAEDAGKLMQACSKERAAAIIKGALNFAGPEADFRTMGWCFGGGWSLQAALLCGTKAKACVVYYGMPESDIEKLKTLSTDVVFVHAQRDKWITDEVVADFERNMVTAGKKLSVYRYDADHAFANPSSPRYQEAAATAAREQVRAYLGSK